MDCSSGNSSQGQPPKKSNQNIQVYLRVRPLNTREKNIRSLESIEVHPPRELIVHHLPNSVNSNMTKKFTFDRAFGQNSKQCEIYQTVVSPLIEEVLCGYNCTVFAYGQTGTGKTHTMIGTECPELKSSWDDDSAIGIIPRALSHLFDELRLMECEFSMRISYLELYNEELCDLLSTDDSTKIRIYDDSSKKGSVIIQGLEEIPVHSKDDVYKLLEKGKERRKTATTLMNAQSSRSHTVFSILVHIKENGIDGEEMLKIGKLNLVDLAGSENVSKAGNEKGIRVRETVNINQSLLTLGRVITALVERTPHIPYRESKLTRLLQESLGGRTKTSIIATISPGHKDIEETLSTLEYAHRAKNIQNKPEVNQKLTKKTVLKEYTEEIDRLKRDLMASRDKNGVYLATETFNDMNYKLESQNKELNEKILLNKVLRDELANKEKMFNEVSLNLVEKTEKLKKTEGDLDYMQQNLVQTKKILNNTKRRYKEKKFLLDTHVKVEEELTTQAKEIMEVADIATKDTFDLHNTIARRKDVDMKIQTACEQFVEKMKKTMNTMDSNLESVKSEHKSHTDLILKQIDVSSKAQSSFDSNANERISNIVKTHSSLVEEFESSIKSCASKVNSLNEEQKLFFESFLSDLRNRDKSMKESITKDLTELNDFFKAHSKLNTDYMENLTKEVERTHSAYTTHSSLLKNNLETISKQTSENFLKAITAVKSDSEKRTALQAEKTEALEAMMKVMKQIEAINIKEQAYNQSLSSVSADLETGKDQFTNDVNLNVLKPLAAYDLEKEQQRICFYKGMNIVEQLNEADQINSESQINKTIKKISDLETERNDLFQNNLQAMNDNSGKIAVEMASVTAIVSEKKEGSNSLIEHNCQDVKDVITTEGTRIKECNTFITAYTESLNDGLIQYSSTYNSDMKDCLDLLDDFKSKELQTYTPTGETPMKKEFKYPRILACTSPHNKIIKRLREENEWSDMDATIACDEDSETTINEVPDNPLVVNSTPIKLKRTNSEPNCVITANNLKALKSARNSEQAGPISPLLDFIPKPKKGSTPVIGGKTHEKEEESQEKYISALNEIHFDDSLQKTDSQKTIILSECSEMIPTNLPKIESPPTLKAVKFQKSKHSRLPKKADLREDLKRDDNFGDSLVVNSCNYLIRTPVKRRSVSKANKENMVK